MAGMLVQNGQEWVLDRMLEYINASGLHVGLMEEQTTIPETAQIGAGITEIDPVGDATGSGYARIVISGWTSTSGVDPYITGPAVTFTVSGTWQAVNGYFVATGSGDASALWAEPFPSGKFGDKTDGDRIIITPKYEQMDYSE